MKFLAATALAVCTATAGCAPLHPAEQSFAPVKPPEPPPPRLRAVLPPLEYDHPYGGALMITRGDKEVMTKECPKTPFPITIGCSHEYPSTNFCHVFIASDEILKAVGWTYACPQIFFRPVANDSGLLRPSANRCEKFDEMARKDKHVNLLRE
jgi:hypothetical protein